MSSSHCKTGRQLILDYQEDCCHQPRIIQRIDRYIEHLVFCDSCLEAERKLAVAVYSKDDCSTH